jgi:signal transduction histidine kinase
MQRAMGANRAIFESAHPGGVGHEAPVQYLDQLEKYLDVVNEEIDRLNHIVVDFLFAVRPMNMELLEGDINALITEMLSFVHYELEDAHIKAVLDLDETVPLLLIDERHMKQALLNLVKNAMAAMETGGVLTIATSLKNGAVYITVADTGVGIPEEYASKIFEPYFTTKQSGSGLGLTLVFKIIQEHQGEISVKSRPEEGTCFTISLPLPQRERRLISYSEREIEELR